MGSELHVGHEAYFKKKKRIIWTILWNNDHVELGEGGQGKQEGNEAAIFQGSEQLTDSVVR